MQNAIIAIAAGQSIDLTDTQGEHYATVTAVWLLERGLGSLHSTPVAGSVPAFRMERYSEPTGNLVSVAEGQKVTHGGQTFVAQWFETDDEAGISLAPCAD